MKKLTTLVIVLTAILALTSCNAISTSVANGTADSRTDAAMSLININDGIHLNVATDLDDEKVDMDIQILQDNMAIKADIGGIERTIIQDDTYTYVLSDDLKIGYLLNNEDESELITLLSYFKNFNNLSSSVIDEGKIEIEKASYIYEAFNVTTLLDTTVKFCYDGNDNLSYIVFTDEDSEKTIAINKIDTDINEDSFTVPEDYNISEE